MEALIKMCSPMDTIIYNTLLLVSVSSLVLYIWFRLPCMADLRTRSYCRCKAADTSFNNRVIPQLEEIPYNVPFWYNKHLGATIPFGYHPNLKFEREVYSHECGSQFAADWYPSRPTAHTTRICVFVPGLGSNTDHKYVQQFVRHMAEQKYTCVVVTARGVGMPLTTARVWHPGLTDDVHKVLMTECPAHIPLFFVAFSAGTNILRHTLMRLHDEDRLSVPISVSTTRQEPVRSADTDADIDADFMAERLRATPLLRRTQSTLDVNAPRILRGGKIFCDPRTSVGSNSAVTTGGVARDSKQLGESSGHGQERKRFLVKGAMSVCIAGEDYVQARTYLEQHLDDDAGDRQEVCSSQKQDQVQDQECAGQNRNKCKSKCKSMPRKPVGVCAEALEVLDEDPTETVNLLAACRRGLNSLEGLAYSLLMTKLYKSILLSNPQITHLIADDLMRDLHACTYMSELDTKCNWKLFNFESEQHMVDTFSVNRDEVREKVTLPMLLVQPLDDPLHKSNPYYSIEVDMYTRNPNIIYAEIDHGNHFGFYEGNNLLNMFENKRCYTYPPKLATVFFQNIMDQQE